MRKRRRSSAHKKAQTQKKAVTGNDRPKRLSAAVAKINMELWDNFSDKEYYTDSSYGLSDSFDPDIY